MSNRFAAVLFLVLTSAGPSFAQNAHAGHAGHARQAEVAERGASVMPFDLDRTTHVFDETATGGVQAVTSDDGDSVQMDLIRAHLRTEAEAFSRGDFSSPARIHGEDMPGLAVLRQAGTRLAVAYETTPQGAAVRYRSDDLEVVAALHLWFAAQKSDHGAHAAH